MTDRTWNAEALTSLGQNAILFARTLTSLTEALMREGCPERQARQEARSAAMMAACFNPDLLSDETDDKCPLCGKR